MWRVVEHKVFNHELKCNLGRYRLQASYRRVSESPALCVNQSLVGDAAGVRAAGLELDVGQIGQRAVAVQADEGLAGHSRRGDADATDRCRLMVSCPG